MENQSLVTVYMDAIGNFNATGCDRYVSCNSVAGERQWLSTMRQVGPAGCGWYDKGMVVPPNTPNSVLAVPLVVPNLGKLWVDAAAYDSTFIAGCMPCCIEA